MTGNLIGQFLFSSLLLLACVGLHGLGLFSLSRALRGETNAERLRKLNPLSPRGALFTLSVVIAIILLHGIEIWLFAGAYLWVGAVGSLEEALYYSTISYSTVGYSDAHVVPQWRLAGAFESILGVILLGWSTAFFFRILGRIDPH